jgi:hypothetical protein
MKRRTRYLLIIIGFIFFLITAPLIVLYVGGITYDFDQNRYVKTGILVVNTDPTGAKLFINDLPEGSTPKRVKFLKPGEHTVSLIKDGYFPWTKRLEIKSEKATWTAVGVDNVHLIKNKLDIKTLTNDVIDFEFTNDGLIYISAGQVGFIQDDEVIAKDSLTLPKSVNKIEMSPNKQLALLSGDESTLLLEINNKKFYDLSTLDNPLGSLEFSSTNELFLLNEGVLSSVDWVNGTLKQITTNITTYSTAENSIYVLAETENKKLSLQVFPRNTDPTQGQVLATDITNFNSIKLLVTKNKEVFILGDSAVYRVNNELTKVADGITDWQYITDTNSLMFISPSELNHYDFSNGTTELISRSSNSFIAPLLETNIGYVFFGQNSELLALELDRRDVQNSYSLMQNIDLKKILSTSNARFLYSLDKNSLLKLTIRE